MSTPAAPTTPTPRPWAAGHVIVTVVVALVVGWLLNAQDLLATAERQEFGWQRDVAVAIARPVARVSAALALDRPRDAVDRAMGRAGPAVEVVLTPTPTPTVAGPVPSETATPTPTPTPTPAGRGDRPITAADPLTVWIGGDSMVGQFGPALEDTLFKTDVVETLEVVFEFESGLTRPDFIDWPARLRTISAVQDPEVMVLFFGGNDAQPLKLDDVVHDVDSPVWQAEYRRRVAGVMDDLVTNGHVVYWMGLPVPEADTMVPKFEILNEIYASEAESRGDAVRFFPSWELFAGPDGRYSEFLPDDDGDVVDMRLDDGIHLTTAGGYRLARALAATIATDFNFPSQ